jgi:aminopeptidase N
MKTVYLKDYKKPDFLIPHIALFFSIEEEEKTWVRSTLTVLPQRQGACLRLDGWMEPIQVKKNGVLLIETKDYQREEGGLLFSETRDLEPYSLEIETSLDPRANHSMEGLYVSRGIHMTQCEPQGFRHIAFSLDQPDVLSIYRVQIEAPEGYELLSNGNLIEQRNAEKPGRIQAIWEDPFPKPSYLFALVAGRLSFIKDHFVTREGKSVELFIYGDEQEKDQWGHAMASLKKSMAWDEERFGLSCDVDRYMVVSAADYNMGAMENKGLNIFNASLLVSHPEATTDSRYQDIEGVIAHEYFHNWTGNRVTCRDWFQLCLKEGLTVFRDQLFSESTGLSPHVVRIQGIQDLKNRQYPEDGGGLAHPPRPDSFVEINNFYTATVYNKGAEIVRMIHTVLGEEGFRKGLRWYLKKFDGQAVTQEDFIEAMGEGSGQDLTPFMSWYTQSGTPTVTLDSTYHDGTLTLRWTQTIPQNQGFLPIPVRLGLLDRKSGEPLAFSKTPQGPKLLETLMVLAPEAVQEIRFFDVPSEPLVSSFRGFSAPVFVKDSLSPGDEKTLLLKDPDPIKRWETGQRVFQRLILDQDWQGGGELLGQLFHQNPLVDPGYYGLLWRLPSFDSLSLERDPIPVESILETRRALAARAGKLFKDRLWGIYQEILGIQAQDFSPKSMGLRALKWTCLSYLAYSKESPVGEALTKELDRASFMTDALGAMGLLVSFGTAEERTWALSTFYDRYKSHPTALDDWFGVQASCPYTTTLQVLEDLLIHPDFTILNPNRVRSVYGSMSRGHPGFFHSLTGEGYGFLCRGIKKLDGLNPQLAAGLAKGFSGINKHTKDRQELLRQVMEKEGLGEKAQVTPGLREILTKSLGG